MSIDPMVLVQQAQEAQRSPSPDASPFSPTPGAMRRTRETVLTDHEGRDRSVEDLAATPGSPSYRSKIPPPPCGQCGADHNPIWDRQGRYDHAYLHPDTAANGGVVMLNPMVPGMITQVAPTPAPVSAPAAVPVTLTKRMSIFPGRGDDDYVVVVERYEDNDWEDDYKQKMTGEILAAVLPIFDSLGVKIKDRTGGDLVELRQREC